MNSSQSERHQLQERADGKTELPSISKPEILAAHHKLDAIIKQKSVARWVDAYYDPEGPFGAGLFSLVSDNPPFEITVSDLYAITLLGADMEPKGVRCLLFDERIRDHFSDLLKVIGPDEDIWLSDQFQNLLKPAYRLYREIQIIADVDNAAAGMLLSRKRPRLLPMIDNVVASQFNDADYRYWVVVQDYLTSDDRREVVDSLRPSFALQGLSTLQILHAAIWISRSQSRPARQLRFRGTGGAKVERP